MPTIGNQSPQVAHVIPQQVVQIPVPQQLPQQQLQYRQTNVSESQSAVSSLPHVLAQHPQIVQLSHHQQQPPQQQPHQNSSPTLHHHQQHQQNHNQLANKPTGEMIVQDPLDVHHEMHVTQHNQTGQ